MKNKIEIVNKDGVVIETLPLGPKHLSKAAWKHRFTTIKVGGYALSSREVIDVGLGIDGLGGSGSTKARKLAKIIVADLKDVSRAERKATLLTLKWRLDTSLWGSLSAEIAAESEEEKAVAAAVLRTAERFGFTVKTWGVPGFGSNHKREEKAKALVYHLAERGFAITHEGDVPEGIRI